MLQIWVYRRDTRYGDTRYKIWNGLCRNVFSYLVSLYLVTCISQKSCNSPFRSLRLPPRRQPNDEHQVVGLHLGLVGGTATADLSAFGAFGDDDIALLGIGLCGDGLQIPSAGIGAVAGVDVHVPRPEAEGTVVAGGVAQGLDLFAAMDADKAVVQLGKAFLFHVVSFHRIQDFREMGMNGGKVHE